MKFEISPGEASVRWQLEGREASAGWFPLEVVSTEELVEAPPNLRQAAIEELRRNHFQYLWLDGHPELADLRNHPQEWGIRLIAEFQEISLYRID